jgi:hypothetical protein
MESTPRPPHPEADAAIDPLRDIPDFGRGFALEAAHSWLDSRLAALATMMLEANIPESFTSITAPADEAARRRFLAGTLLADWACFESAADRVDLPRLRHVIDTFPGGFRLWLCRIADGQYTPVGYTGWYPIAAKTFETMLHHPETIPNRGFMAPCTGTQAGGAIYIFNYSILPGLRRLPHSRTLLQTLSGELLSAAPQPLAAVAVSDDGIRVARRLGMEVTGRMTHLGETEYIMIQASPSNLIPCKGEGGP